MIFAMASMIGANKCQKKKKDDDFLRQEDKDDLEIYFDWLSTICTKDLLFKEK